MERCGLDQPSERGPRLVHPLTLSDVVVRGLSVLSQPETAQSAQLDVRLWSEALHNPEVRRIFLDSEGNLSNFLEAAARRTGSMSQTEDNAEAAAILVAALVAEQKIRLLILND